MLQIQLVVRGGLKLGIIVLQIHVVVMGGIEPRREFGFKVRRLDHSATHLPAPDKRRDLRLAMVALLERNKHNRSKKNRMIRVHLQMRDEGHIICFNKFH